jgi:hypothetical protein
VFLAFSKSSVAGALGQERPFTEQLESESEPTPLLYERLSADVLVLALNAQEI